MPEKKFIENILLLSSLSVIGIVIVIFGIIFITAFPAFLEVGLGFFLGTTWNYDTREFGAFYLISGTVFLVVLTLIMAVPLGVCTAIYLSEWAPKSVEPLIRSMIELLVGIPSVVYGLFAFYVLEKYFRYGLNPFIDSVLGFIPIFNRYENTGGSCFLLAAIVLTIMILPTIVALSLEALRGVPETHREGAFALGSTKWETVQRIVLPGAFPGIVTSIVLATMRAMGETMAIVMVLGTSMHFPRSILDNGAVMTVKIVSDAGYYIALPESRPALFAIAATLILMELFFVVLIRFFSRHFNKRGIKS